MPKARTVRALAATGAAALVAVGAAGAVPCHPDPDGTRTLEVRGEVEGYALRGDRIAFAIRDRGGCSFARWNPLSSGAPSQRAEGSGTRRCGTDASRSSFGRSVLLATDPALPLTARDGELRVALGADGVITIRRNGESIRTIKRASETAARAIRLEDERLIVLTGATYAPDRPARAELYSVRTGGFLASWPLLRDPTTLDVHEDLLIYSARNSGGLFALRLTDGKTTKLGPIQPNDRPQINEHGVVFQSNLYKRFNAQGRVFVKFLPLPVVRRAFERTFHELDVRYPIKAFSMEEGRVGVVLDHPGKECDAVRFWAVTWHSFVRINMRDGATCTEGMAIGDAMAMAGIAVEWVATKGPVSQVVSSDGDKCVEHKAGLLRSRGAALAGDGLLLGFGGLRSGRSGVEVMNWKTHEHVALRSPVAARALAVDQNRIAVLREDGRTDIFGEKGKLLRRLPTKTATRALALRGDQLLTITGRRLDVWTVDSGERLHSWPLPGRIRPEVDLHYGIAVFVSGRTVQAIDVTSGRRVVLARTPSRPRVQIETIGVAYQFNTGRRGALRFVPLSTVEEKLEIG